MLSVCGSVCLAPLARPSSGVGQVVYSVREHLLLVLPLEFLARTRRPLLHRAAAILCEEKKKEGGGKEAKRGGKEARERQGWGEFFLWGGRERLKREARKR
jgi:hypothetical protein